MQEREEGLVASLRELLDIPPELRTPEEQARLDEGLGQSEVLRALDVELAASIDALKGAEDPEPGDSFWRLLEARLDLEKTRAEDASVLATAASSSASSVFEKAPRALVRPEERRSRSRAGMQGMGPQLRQWMPRLALLAAVVLVFVGRGLLTPEPPEQRLRGGNEAAKVAHSISLQAAIESATGELRAVGDGAGFIPGEGLIFRFEVKENGQLSLWESTPSGQWSLVIRKDVGASAEPVELRDEAGTLQRWVPEHGPGSYRYLAILADGNATVDPEGLWTHAGEAEKDSKTAAVSSKGILGWDRLQLELRRETAAPAVGPENHP